MAHDDWHMELGSIRKSTKSVPPDGIIDHIQEKNEAPLPLAKIKLYRTNKISKPVTITKKLQESFLANDDNEWKKFKECLSENKTLLSLWIDFNVERIKNHILTYLKDKKKDNKDDFGTTIDITNIDSKYYLEMLTRVIEDLKSYDLRIITIRLPKFSEFEGGKLVFTSYLCQQLNSQLEYLDKSVSENLSNVTDKTQFMEAIVKLIEFNQDCLNTINETHETSVLLTLEQYHLTERYLDTYVRGQLGYIQSRYVIPYDLYVKFHDKFNQTQSNFDALDKKFQDWLETHCYFMNENDKEILLRPLPASKFLHYLSLVCKLLVVYTPNENIYIDIYNEYILKFLTRAIIEPEKKKCQIYGAFLSYFDAGNAATHCVITFEEVIQKLPNLQELKSLF